MSKKIYIYNDEWFESTMLCNPFMSLDHKLEDLYPNYYSVYYDCRLLLTEETESQIDSFKKIYETNDINEMIDNLMKKNPQMVLLNGFDQKHFDIIIDYIKNVKILYLFKCNRINDLSKLSSCLNLECLHIDWNNKLESLWNMTNNKKLKALSFERISKLTNITELENSSLEYITFDSRNILRQTKYEFNGDLDVFKKMKCLKNLKLYYKNIRIDY